MTRKTFKRGGGKFAKLDHWLLDHWSRLNLSCGARSLHVELIRRFTGSNNGKIYLPTREAAARLDVSRNTVGSYYKELEALGFIAQVRGASLGIEGKGRAAEWRLTHLSENSKPASMDFRNLEPRPKNRAAPAQKSCQGPTKLAPKKEKVAQKPCQVASNPLTKNRANITYSHRQRLAWVANHKGFCGLACASTRGGFNETEIAH